MVERREVMGGGLLTVYDWHVKNRQEIETTRLPDGRYGILFMFTTIVLREDQVPIYIGWGYDAR